VLFNGCNPRWLPIKGGEIVVGKFILSIDQGTTSSRAILFNKNGDIVHIARKIKKLSEVTVF
jgi:hypothetical protein